MRNKLIPLALASATALLLSACTLAHTPRHPAPAPGNVAEAQWLRVIVQFKQPVPYTSATWLADLSRQLGAQVQMITVMSNTTQVYVVPLTSAQTRQQMLDRWQRLPGVSSVEVDQKMQPQSGQ